MGRMGKAGGTVGSYPGYDLPALPILPALCKGADRNRTDEWRFCRPLPYHLATAPEGEE